MPEKTPGQNFDFEQIDADAVCERCGTVNPEETLLCKSCGNNLRDQRVRRIAGEQVLPVAPATASRVRVFTGLITALGIVTILAAVIFMPDIEAWLVDRQIADDGGDNADFWSGPGSEIYNELPTQLVESPTADAVRRQAIETPVLDESYNGRYVLIRQSLSGYSIAGEANLARRGDRVHFVALIDYRGMEIRGFARLAGEDGQPLRPLAQNSAKVRLDGQDFLAWGYGERNEYGGHYVYGQSSHDEGSYGLIAYRIR